MLLYHDYISLVETTLQQFWRYLHVCCKLLTACSKQLGTSSANTNCQRLVNRLVITCLQYFTVLCVYLLPGLPIELQVNWNDNSGGGGGGLKPGWFSFSEFWIELLNAKGWVVYQIEAIKKLSLVYKFQDFN